MIERLPTTSRSAIRRRRSSLAMLCLLLGMAAAVDAPYAAVRAEEADFASTKDADFRPRQSQLPVAPPDDAVVLYGDEGRVNRFLNKHGEPCEWRVAEGALVSTAGGGNKNHVVSELHFCDADIHVEFAVDARAQGNSGVYIHGNYEQQIFDSWKERGKQNLTSHDHGAIYGFHAPLVDASRPPGQWQVYDIRYRAPRRNEAGEIVEQGSMTTWLNGELVQQNSEFGEPRSVYHPYRYGATPYLKEIWTRQLKSSTGPLFLQDHGSPTRFRNVWVRPLDDKAFLYEPDAR